MAIAAVEKIGSLSAADFFHERAGSGSAKRGLNGHRDRFDIQSTTGKGSTFTVTLLAAG
jgi:hypothetical protein